MVKLISLICYILILTSLVTAEESDQNLGTQPLRLGLVHFSPTRGEIETNATFLKYAMTTAKENGADWVLTPELSLTGYYFEEKIGTNWLTNGPDSTVQDIQAHAKMLKLGVLLSHMERPVDQPDSIYNTLFVINPEGKIIGRHQKINTIPQSEDWAKKGKGARSVNIEGYKTGLLICADAWPTFHAEELKQQGVQWVLSSANWAPGIYGPGDTWEKRAQETGVPWVVNNRTGIDKSLDLREAKSVVTKNDATESATKGKRIFEHASEENALILLHWQRTLPSPTLLSSETIPL